MKNLTAKQEKFVQEIAAGSSSADAYRAAYSTKNMKPATIHNNAYIVLQKSEIIARLAELKKELAEKSLWSRQQSVEALKLAIRIAKQEGQSTGVTSAVKELNNMHGYNEPIKLDHTTNGESLAPRIIERVIVDPKDENRDA